MDWLEGDHESARSRIEESLPALKRLGDLQAIATWIGVLSLIAAGQGRFDDARALGEESLAMMRRLDDPHGIAKILLAVGGAAFGQGDYPAACARFEESLTIFLKLDDGWHIAWALEELASTAAAQRQPMWAARLFGAAEALREAGGLPLPSGRRANYERNVAAAREGLDETAFAAAWAEGRARTPEQAIAEEGRAPGPEQASIGPKPLNLPPQPTAPATSPPTYPARLTAREVEVLHLVAGGLTDAQVAEQLSLSPRTVNAHLRSIYNKLGTGSRSAATRFAFEHKLV